MINNLEPLNQAFQSIEGDERADVSIQGHFEAGAEGVVKTKGGLSFTTGRIKDPFKFNFDERQGVLDFEDDPPEDDD